jgi:hypothetical protein
VVELAALEMLCTGNRTVGSNPTLSARKFANARRPLRVVLDGLTSFRTNGVASFMRKSELARLVLFGLLACGLPSPGASARRAATPHVATVCPDPTARCATSIRFEPYQLPFRLPADGVIEETEQFYAVVLKSVRDESRGGDCNVFIPEAERLEAQALFPRQKVFASRCMEAGDLFYTNVADDSQFMAVYAGRTRAEAGATLAKVKATGKYPGANLRRMRAGFNGT